jgi:hypothetical protein
MLYTEQGNMDHCPSINVAELTAVHWTREHGPMSFNDIAEMSAVHWTREHEPLSFHDIAEMNAVHWTREHGPLSFHDITEINAVHWTREHGSLPSINVAELTAVCIVYTEQKNIPCLQTIMRHSDADTENKLHYGLCVSVSRSVVNIPQIHLPEHLHSYTRQHYKGQEFCRLECDAL